MSEAIDRGSSPFQTDPEHLERIAQAHVALAQDNTLEAFEILRDLVDQDTQHWQAFHGLAGIALTQGDLETACDLLRTANSKPGAPSHVTRQLANLIAATGDTAAALATLSPLIRANPADAEVLAQVREIISATPNVSPVAWARLIGDLRAPTQEHLDQISRLDACEKENAKLVAENRRFLAIIDSLRSELNLPRVARWNSSDTDAWTTIHQLDDRAWLSALVGSVDVPSYQGFPMAGFPSEQLQVGMIGSSNEAALREGFNFYAAVRDIVCGRNLQAWDGEGKLLDFGTGWGRYARIFMKDFRPENVFGVDVDPSCVKVCRETFPYAQFDTVPALPPTTIESGFFDLIIAYSVFSHLAEHAATAWIHEFERILKPGGMVAITTQGRSLLQVCERIRKEQRFDHDWHRKLARSFIDRAACEAAYDRGEFLYSATGGGDARPSDFYGEALIPRGFVERHWCDAFELIEFIDDRARLPQALIVLRKLSRTDS